MGAVEGSFGGALAVPSNTGTSPRSPSTSAHAPHQFQSNTSPLSKKWSSPTTSPSNGRFKRRKIDWKGKGRAVDDEGDDDGMALPPVILALDVDCFYAQACRIRDPTLNGIPLGVQQKTILAAVSYEARAVGVPKIVSMREALRILPSLTIVNGEDLSFFRLLSNRSWRLMRSLVWGERVEKCGMDELWADVTETVDDHLLRCEMDMVNRDEELGTFLSFDQLPLERMQPVDLTRGFWYRPSDPIPGYFQPEPHSFSKGWPEDPWRQRYALGSHITYFFRRIIREQVNLECSGGVSFSKQMAKLIGSANKPAKQTCFCPAQPLESPHVSRADFYRQFLQDAQEYIDPLELGKLNGFGHVYVKKLEEIQQQGQYPTSYIPESTTTTTPREETHSHADWLNGHLDSVKSKNRLTVQKTRTNFSLPQFTSLFGPTIGPRLWSILHAIDTEPVAIASDFAAQQISIEDTYRNLPAGTACVNEMRKLGEGLMKRLEVECVEMPDEAWVLAVRASSRQRAIMETVVVGLGEEQSGAGSSVGKEEKVLTQVRNYVDVEEEEQEEERKEAGAHAISNGKGYSNAPKLKTWRRYPLSVRLSLRIGWGARFSKTGKMPIGVFDLTQPRKKRAEILLSTLLSLFRQMTAGRDVSEGFNLINIAALELSKSPPASHDIKNLLSKASSMYGGHGQNGSVGRFPQRGGDEVGARAGSGSAMGTNIAVQIQPVPRPAIDLEVLKDLPPDIAAEVAQEYGIPWPPAEPPPSIHTPSLATDPFQQSSPQDDEWPDLPSTPPFLSQPSSPSSPPQQIMIVSASLSPTPSFMSYPPSQLSAQSFSPPPLPRVRLKSPRPSSPAVEDPVIASEAEELEEEAMYSDSPLLQPQPEAAVDTPQSRPSTRFGHFELSSYDPPSQPKRLLDAGISTQQQHPLCPSSQRFGHFELSGCEMSVDELERFLSPPTPPPLVADLGPSPPPVGAMKDMGTEVGLGVATLSPPPAEPLPLPLPAPLLAPLMEGDPHLVVGGEVGLASQELGGHGAIPEQQGRGQEVVGVGAGDERDVAGGWERRACGQCGREMVIWLQHDHDVFGASGLPPGFEAEGYSIREER